MFWDTAAISVKAGRGGDGLISFRHEIGESKGGPDGGDGGNGGSVTLKASTGLNTLGDYARQKEFIASGGRPGGKAKRHGKSAEDLVLPVPVGTIIMKGSAVLADLAEAGQESTVVRGGRGGFGNAHFTSSTRQAPRQAELGEPGEEADLKLELRLVADIGLVGVPSVGKSTLLSRFTAAKPKIADYPFTTTVPQLGIATVDRRHFTIADIPGLIEGAHQGKGLGDAFLRHVERTKVIIHLLDATRADPVADYQQIRAELNVFSESLAHKPELVGINKADTLDEELTKLLKEDIEQRLGRAVVFVSGVSGFGLTELLRQAAQTAEQAVAEPAAELVPVFTLADLAPQAVTVEPAGDHFVIHGATIERLAKQTDFSNYQAADRFWWVFRKLGADKQLERLGATPGAKVYISSQEFTWHST